MVRNWTSSALRAIDRRLGRRIGPVRVLIELRTPMNVAVLEPIWRHMSRDSRTELEFIAEDPISVGRALEAAGASGVLLHRDEVVWRRYDLAINADPWNPVRLRRCWRRANFFHGVAGKYDLDRPDRLAIDFGIYDRVMFPNADRMRRYIDAGAVAADRAELVGFPKTDDLVNGTWDPAAVRQELGLSPELETVLYAPTFSQASSLHAAGERIIETLLATGRNVIVKLHDRSLVPHPKFTADIDWRARLSRFAGCSRFAFPTAPHATPYLAAADVLVTDHSTVGFEFALLDRPIVVFDTPELLEAARIHADRWEQLRSMADVVRNTDELRDAVIGAFSNRARFAARRRAVAEAAFAHAGSATARALSVVYELLDMTPPVAPDAPAPALVAGEGV